MRNASSSFPFHRQAQQGHTLSLPSVTSHPASQDPGAGGEGQSWAPGMCAQPPSCRQARLTPRTSPKPHTSQQGTTGWTREAEPGAHMLQTPRPASSGQCRDSISRGTNSPSPCTPGRHPGPHLTKSGAQVPHTVRWGTSRWPSATLVGTGNGSPPSLSGGPEGWRGGCCAVGEQGRQTAHRPPLG